MATCKIVQATSAEDLESHYRVRWQVYGIEERLFKYENPSGLDTDDDDARPNTLHFNVVVADEAQTSAEAVVGAGRLILPDPERAAANGWRYGLPFENDLDIVLPADISPAQVGEMGRMCVLKPYRHLGYTFDLLIEMCQDSLRRGVPYWIAFATADTDSPTRAVQVMRSLEALGLTRKDVSLELRDPNDPHDQALRGIEVEGQADWKSLPPVVGLDARLGCRYYGRPVFYKPCGIYVMPLLGSVQEIMTNAQAMLQRLKSR